MDWTANGSSHRYTFAYDGLNRLTAATHGAGQYTEKVTGYDKNGNILSLQRYGQTSASAYGLIDNLTFTLVGNRRPVWMMRLRPLPTTAASSSRTV